MKKAKRFKMLTFIFTIYSFDYGELCVKRKILDNKKKGLKCQKKN